MIKGPQEYALEARQLAQEARYREIKEALALKWEIEDMRRRKSKSEAAKDESKPSKPRAQKRKTAETAEGVVAKQKPAGFGSKRYEASLLADPKLKARDAKRRRAAGLATQAQESEEEEEEEHEMADEEGEEAEDPNYITPKRSKTAPAKHGVWPVAATPSTAGGAASASLPRDPTFAPQQNRQSRSGGEPRPRTARARALEPTLRNLPVEASSQDATQAMDDGETPQIFLTVAAQRKAEQAAAASAAAESPLLISKKASMAAPEYIAKKLPTPARGGSSAASASLPLPNAALLVANAKHGLFSLEDEAVVDAADTRRKINQMRLAASTSGKSKSMENQTPRRKEAKAAAPSPSSLEKDPFAFDLD